MASFTRSNGDAQQVMHMDTGNGHPSGALTADALVNSAGPALDFFALVVENGSNQAIDLQNELDAGEAVEAILREIQQTATVAVYQVEDDTTGQISLAVYPQGAYTNTTLTQAITGLGSSVGSNSVDVSGSQATDEGFKLALS